MPEPLLVNEKSLMSTPVNRMVAKPPLVFVQLCVELYSPAWQPLEQWVQVPL